ncbi:MAG: hypothetical protein AAF429_04310 [Pseudomonadota bacterium]
MTQESEDNVPKTENVAMNHGHNIGQKDQHGRVIKNIYQDKPDYLIYGTHHGISLYNAHHGPRGDAIYKAVNDLTDLDAQFHILLHALFPEDPSDLDNFVSIASLGRALRHRIFGRYEGRTKYESEYAALVAAVLDDRSRLPTVTVQMQDLFARMRMERTHRMRVSFLTTNLFCVFAVLIFFSILQATEFNMFGFNLKQFAIAAMMGGIGALFSTATSLKRLEMDPLLNPYVHLVYASQRILVGVLAAVILLFGFHSGVLFDILSPPNSDAPAFVSSGDKDVDLLYWIGFMSVLAGFSERLVPNLLATQSKRLEDHQTTFTEYELEKIKEVLAERDIILKDRKNG